MLAWLVVHLLPCRPPDSSRACSNGGEGISCLGHSRGSDGHYQQMVYARVVTQLMEAQHARHVAATEAQREAGQRTSGGVAPRASSVDKRGRLAPLTSGLIVTQAIDLVPFQPIAARHSAPLYGQPRSGHAWFQRISLPLSRLVPR